MHRGIAQRGPWLALWVLALWLLCSLGVRPLLLPDEGRYASVAREMLFGDGLTPTLNGLPYFHKPPLLYWLDMAAMSVFGVNAWAARLGPALGGFVLAGAAYLHLRRVHGNGVAQAGLALLATMPMFFIGAQYTNHDMLVAGCISVAVLALWRAVDDPLRVDWRWQALGGLACGLAVVSKGLIGVVLPVLVLAPWLVAQRRWRSLVGLLHPAGLLTLLAVALPWMLLMEQRHPGFFDYFIVEQHFRRFTGVTFNNVQPWWFFVPVLPLLTLPWSLGLWPAVRAAGARRDAQAALPLWWLVVVVGFFSLPNSKLVGYVMPALVPLVLLLTPWLAARARLLRWGLLVMVVALPALLVWMAIDAHGSHRDVSRALAAQVQPVDRVVFIDGYFFDIPFDAGLTKPVLVVSNWADPALPLHDNWRKELFDAAQRFGSPAQRQVLWPVQREQEVLCHDQPVWLVVPAVHAARIGAWPGVERVLQGRHAELFRAAPRVCAGPLP